MSRALALLLLAGSLATPAQAERDPTRPPGYGQAVAPAAVGGERVDLRLSGIISGPRGRSAMLNGQRVSSGDQVADARVITVAHDRVEIERGGERIVIKLTTTEVKRPAPVAGGEN